jgi:hypothetical protein
MATAGGVETAELGDLACREGIFSQRISAEEFFLLLT